MSPNNNFSKSRSNTLVYLIVIFMPFLQMGFSYYFSICFLLFLGSLFYSLKGNSSLAEIELYISLGAIPFLIKIISLAFLSVDNRAFLIPMREMICFWGIIIITVYIAASSINELLIRKIFISFLILLLVMVLTQVYFLSRGQYFGLPIDYFIMNQETLNKAEDALFHGTRYRATAFYGEPSYTSWIVLSILCIILNQKYTKFKFQFISILLSFLIVSISQSMAGILAVFIFSITWYFLKEKGKKRNILITLSGLITLTGITLFMISDFGEIGSRFKAILENNDASANNRLNDPLTYLEETANHNRWLALTNYAQLSINNVGLGLAIHYGVLVIPIIIILLYFVKRKLLILYLLLSLNFNGTFFRFDKVLVVSMALGLSRIDFKREIHSKSSKFKQEPISII